VLDALKTISGLRSAQTEAAMDRAFDTWQAEQCMKKLDLVKRVDNGADPQCAGRWRKPAPLFTSFGRLDVAVSLIS
jgi:hypothetical protein